LLQEGDEQDGTVNTQRGSLHNPGHTACFTAAAQPSAHKGRLVQPSQPCNLLPILLRQLSLLNRRLRLLAAAVGRAAAAGRCRCLADSDSEEKSEPSKEESELCEEAEKEPAGCVRPAAHSGHFHCYSASLAVMALHAIKQLSQKSHWTQNSRQCQAEGGGGEQGGRRGRGGCSACSTRSKHSNLRRPRHYALTAPPRYLPPTAARKH
jgi:hypothetical protein